MNRQEHVAWIPTDGELLRHVVTFLQLAEDDILYDLGCGDGRVVIEACKLSECSGIGIEHSTELVALARQNVRTEGLQKKIRIYNGDLLKHDLGNASVVYLFLHEDIIDLLLPKISNARIVIHHYSENMMRQLIRIDQPPLKLERISELSWLAEFPQNTRRSQASLDLEGATDQLAEKIGATNLRRLVRDMIATKRNGAKHNRHSSVHS